MHISYILRIGERWTLLYMGLNEGSIPLGLCNKILFRSVDPDCVKPRVEGALAPEIC